MPIMMMAELNGFAKREIKTLGHNSRGPRTITIRLCSMLALAGTPREKKKNKRHPFYQHIPEGSFHLIRRNFQGKTERAGHRSSIVTTAVPTR